VKNFGKHFLLLLIQSKLPLLIKLFYKIIIKLCRGKEEEEKLKSLNGIKSKEFNLKNKKDINNNISIQITLFHF